MKTILGKINTQRCSVTLNITEHLQYPNLIIKASLYKKKLFAYDMILIN